MRYQLLIDPAELTTTLVISPYRESGNYARRVSFAQTRRTAPGPGEFPVNRRGTHRRYYPLTRTRRRYPKPDRPSINLSPPPRDRPYLTRRKVKERYALQRMSDARCTISSARFSKIHDEDFSLFNLIILGDRRRDRNISPRDTGRGGSARITPTTARNVLSRCRDNCVCSPRCFDFTRRNN